MAILAAAATLAGCERAEEPAAPAPAAPSSSEGPPSVLPAPWQPSPDRSIARFLGYRGPKPVTWEEYRPENRLRVANWVVPGREGSNQGHVAVFDLGVPTVDLATYIELWSRRFRPDDDGRPPEARITEAQTVSTLPVTFVELRGDYVRPGAQWYTSDQILLVAVIEPPEGAIHVRLTGETATVEAQREAFERLVLKLEREEDR